MSPHLLQVIGPRFEDFVTGTEVAMGHDGPFTHGASHEGIEKHRQENRSRSRCAFLLERLPGESFPGLPLARTIPVGQVDWKRAFAPHKDGVLNVTPPKVPGALDNRVKIYIQSEGEG